MEIRKPEAVKAFVDQIRDMGDTGAGILGGNNGLLLKDGVSA